MMNTCLVCDSTLIKWQKKFCSRSCAAKHNNVAHPKRPPSTKPLCRVCNKRLWRDNSIYCQDCRTETLYNEYIARWKDGTEPGGSDYGVSTHVRKYLYRVRGEKCELCDWAQSRPADGKIPLTIHHIGRYDDHRETMLQILCPNCHSLTSTYGALNRGNGRTYRYEGK